MRHVTKQHEVEMANDQYGLLLSYRGISPIRKYRGISPIRKPPYKKIEGRISISTVTPSYFD